MVGRAEPTRVGTRPRANAEARDPRARARERPAMGFIKRFFTRSKSSKRAERAPLGASRADARAVVSSSQSASASASASVVDGLDAGKTRMGGSSRARFVAVSNDANEHHTYARIECPDRVGLLSEIATRLCAEDVCVVQAEVMRDSKRVLYTLYVCEEETRCKLSEQAGERIADALEDIVGRDATAAGGGGGGGGEREGGGERGERGDGGARAETRGDANAVHGEDGDVVTRLGPQPEEDRDETFTSKERSVHGISFDDRDVENATEIKMQVLDRRGLMADFCKACVAKGISVIRGTLYTVGDTVENCFLLLDTKTHGKVNDKDLAYIKSALLLRRQRRAISQRLSIPRDADFVPLEQTLPGGNEDLSGIQNTQFIDAATPMQSWELEIFASALRSIPAVRHAGLAGLLVESLGAAATRLVFPEGETVLQAGEGADTFYILIDGKVNVSPDGATLKSGDTWGEEVLTEPTPSSSTLVAAEESVLLGITRKAFAKVIRDVMSRARKAAYDTVMACPVFKPFEHASLEALSELLVQRGRRAYRAGEVIYRDGMQAKMFMVMDGEVERRDDGTSTSEKTKITSGGYFGDEILTGETTLTGVYIAVTDVVILTCTQNFVLQVIGVDSVNADTNRQSSAEGSNDRSGGVNIPGVDGRQRGSNSALAGLSLSAIPSAPNLTGVLGGSSDESSSSGIVFKSVSATERKPPRARNSLLQKTSTYAGSTGHLPALAEHPSPPRALGRSAADAAGTPDPSPKKEKTANVTSSLSPALRSHSPTLGQLQSAKTLDEFDVVDVLGQGMVGLVLRAKHRTSGKVCAIKTMPKSQIMEHGEEEHCMAEVRALKELRHAPFVCNYYASFQDPWALYLVMEDCVGDMFDLFNQSGLPGIGQIKVYTAQVLLGLEYIHNAGYVYRDMKPENLLLRSDGSITIGDFGFAKKLEKGERAYTICGTPDYLAPELILHQGCTRAADIWAFGILVFEMIAGFPPFRDRKRRELYKRIVRADFAAVPVPRRMDNDVHDMLMQIFVRDESLRLGIRAPGVSAIKGHAWFETIDWNAVMSGQLRPLHFLPDQLGDRDREESVSKIRDGATGKFTWMTTTKSSLATEKIFADY